MFFKTTLLIHLYVKVGIILTCGIHLHDSFISLSGEGLSWSW